MLIVCGPYNHTAGGEGLTAKVEASVEGALARFGGRITRVLVHLTDVSNSTRTHDFDKRCTMEARIAGHQPVSVSHQGGDLLPVVDAASHKLAKALDAVLGRLDHSRGRPQGGGGQER